jgi:penicillin-binding protein 2
MDEDMLIEYSDPAWFAGFAQTDSPKVAFAVLVEHGGHGGSAAAPIAKKLLEKYIELYPGTITKDEIKTALQGSP